MNLEMQDKPRIKQSENQQFEKRIFDTLKTQANDTEFVNIISGIDDEFRNVLDKTNILNLAHASDTKFFSNTYQAFVEQIRNDLSTIVLLQSSLKNYGEKILKERHWDIAKSIYQKYSFNGELYQAIEKSNIPDSKKLKMVMAINSLLKNVDIYLQENKFYEFYELCRAKFEPDATETENNSVSNVDSSK